MQATKQFAVSVISGLVVAALAFYLLNESSRDYGQIYASKSYITISKSDFDDLLNSVLKTDYEKHMPFLKEFGSQDILLERVTVKNRSKNRVHDIVVEAEGDGHTVSIVRSDTIDLNESETNYSLKPEEEVEFISISYGITEYSFGITGGRKLTITSDGHVIKTQDLVLNPEYDYDAFFLKFFREWPIVGIAAFIALGAIIILILVWLALELFITNQAEFIIKQTDDKSLAKNIAVYRAIHKLYPDRKAKIDQLAIGEFSKYADYVKKQSRLNDAANKAMESGISDNPHKTETSQVDDSPEKIGDEQR